MMIKEFKNRLAALREIIDYEYEIQETRDLNFKKEEYSNLTSFFTGHKILKYSKDYYNFVNLQVHCKIEQKHHVKSINLQSIVVFE